MHGGHVPGCRARQLKRRHVDELADSLHRLIANVATAVRPGPAASFGNRPIFSGSVDDQLRISVAA
jgi:hypothetical protein